MYVYVPYTTLNTAVGVCLKQEIVMQFHYAPAYMYQMFEKKVKLYVYDPCSKYMYFWFCPMKFVYLVYMKYSDQKANLKFDTLAITLQCVSTPIKWPPHIKQLVIKVLKVFSLLLILYMNLYYAYKQAPQSVMGSIATFGHP